jgi:hypothetical protein
MDEFVTAAAAGPAAAEKSLVAVEPFLADLTVPGFNPQQHGFPISAGFSDAHGGKYSQAARKITSTAAGEWHEVRGKV